MIAGKTLQELAQIVETQRVAKRDYRADTRKLSWEPDGVLKFNLAGGDRFYTPTRLCTQQVADRVGIPQKYFDRMQAEAPELLARNVNHWFQAAPDTRLVRTLNAADPLAARGTARAFLTERYRPLDNHGLLGAILPELAKFECQVKSCEVTEKRLYLQVVTPKIQQVIERINPQMHVPLPAGVDDIVQAGLVISNSEVGCGSLRVEPMVFRLACLNGLIVSTSMKRHHVGGRCGGGDGDEPSEVFTNETLAQDDKAFWLKVRDVVRSAVNQVEFAKTCRKLNEATGRDLGNPIDVVEITGTRFGLTDGEQESVLQHYCKGADLSQFGLIQAVTRSAEDSDDYDRAIELERMGGQILELPASTFLKN